MPFTETWDTAALSAWGILEIEFLEDRGLTRRRADAAAGEPQRSRSVPPAGSFGEIVESGQHLRCPPRTVA